MMRWTQAVAVQSKERVSSRSLPAPALVEPVVQEGGLSPGVWVSAVRKVTPAVPWLFHAVMEWSSARRRSSPHPM
ncbi:MAG: hypothetical protein HP493_06390 [Nitrospira sp.]|nr:hypothetical protein [Nitrospira sp.]